MEEIIYSFQIALESTGAPMQSIMGVTVLTKKLPLDSSAITVLGHGGNHIFIPNFIGIHWSTNAIHYAVFGQSWQW